MASGNFISGILSRPGSKGALHRQLGVPEGETIPHGLLEAAARKGGKLGQRARFALELENMRK